MKHKWKQPKLKKIRGVKCWKSKWRWRVWQSKDKFHLGCGTDIGTGTEFFCHEIITIGDKVQIGGHCLFYTLNTQNKTRGRITIWSNAKIGANTIIFPGVVIHIGEKIPAGSIVFLRNGQRIIKRRQRIIK